MREAGATAASQGSSFKGNRGNIVQEALVYGPVPSRRLGRSLGVNHIPPKVCSYACIYCQLGGDRAAAPRRSRFHTPEAILEAAQTRVASLRERGEAVDYIALVPDGEPTLDANLGSIIAGLRSLGIKIAVISNGSLISQGAVRAELAQADWVSLKVDAFTEDTWQRVNRPHPSLGLTAIQESMLAFRRKFDGFLATETMLVAGTNDSPSETEAIAEFLTPLGPDRAYIAVPTRPPALPWVAPAPEERLNAAYQAFQDQGLNVELLIGYEGDAFAAGGDPEADLLSITAVHPMREDAVRRLLERDHADWEVVSGLMEAGRLVELGHGGHRFYMRRLPGRAVDP